MEYVSSDRKLLPYGMMNFEDIRLDNYYYVDKTSFIPLIEQSDRFFFFIRPRRFGKSLTLNMLQHYYDVRTKDKFDSLFGDLYIGKHPTKDRNSYLVIKLNFSGITGELHNYRKSLDEHCRIVFDYFCDVYADYLPEGIKEKMAEKDGAVSQFEYLFTECARVNQKIYLFIDEYDHFTNTILSDVDSLNRYTDETHKEGYLRAFFNKIKSGTDSSIKRCFITGVSPVTMDDLTSGFNIGTNYSLSPRFNEMMGFTEDEVRKMLTYYSTTSHFSHTVDELIELMKPWYDNYCFAQESYGRTTMYNSNMVLYFVKNYIEYNGGTPKDMIEDNIRIDYEKLRMLIRKDKEFAHDASIIQTLVSQGYITGELKKGFPAASIIDPDNFVSLLYYFGMLTISGTHEGKCKLTIPNQVVREQLYTYLLNTYNDANLSFSSYEKNELSSALAYRGTWKTYFDYIADCLKRYASQRDKQKGESFVHGFTLAMTAQNRFYRPISEADTQEGYADIFLSPLLDIYPDMKHSYVIELKYAKYKDPENRVEELRLEGIAQTNRYADTDTVKNAIGTTQLHKIVVVYKGMEMRVCEEV
ncbi:ATP-binding protein [Bacteroides caccae]|uniref:AAA family ATPase n=1 Tax=Bacteroides caccae TaxID=47678 RepID=UPI001C2BC988|nr:AAA family ATPase [Bacteroides caccae]MBU9957289.1 ATP-binding protein [Bacteroides caccae]MBV3648518.1 ATP-binding protein [Bacteroides caccae]MBV3673585.1 ATP-binding protein [Bacteroides caccae]MBV3679908.1 ATP-binding protein [Bacteroides caccae]MBV3698855.1 ATP-binding protein [Bacteroides caccae]